jgi:uncharacterized Zn finger protein
MCKHVAAVLYGVGARLDERPELLFLLRSVDQQDLIARADTGLRSPKKGPDGAKVLESDNLSEMFGIEIAQMESASVPTARRRRTSGGVRSATPAPKTRTPQAGSKTATDAPGSSAVRGAAISARMKAYWRERRKHAP